MILRRTQLLPTFLLASAQLAACQDPLAPEGTVGLTWTTTDRGVKGHRGLGTIGGDGPWEALTVALGYWDNSNDFNRSQFAVWPSPWLNVSEIPSEKWDHKNLVLHQAELEAALQIQNYTRRESNTSGDYFNVGTRLRDWDLTFPSYSWLHHVKAPVAALSSSIRHSAGVGFANDVGNLALAPNNDTGSTGSILQHLRKAGKIESNSFGLHIGAAKNTVFQGGNLVLGGYNPDRVMGEVAVFDLMDDSASTGASYLPKIYLADVQLGVDEGGVPFDWPASWGKVRRIMDELPRNSKLDLLARKQKGMGIGSTVLVVPDPTVPLMYLPPGACEHAAEHLPIWWNSTLALWIWNMTDPRFERIMRSPAHMNFVLRNGRNRFQGADSFPISQTIHIKVPFSLLNLTLEHPVLPEQDQTLSYFPCRSVEPTEGYWKLGRAFLQSAFLGVNYDQNLIYMAQAPGLYMTSYDHSNRRRIKSTDEFLPAGRNISERLQTWQGFYTPIPEPATPSPTDSVDSSRGSSSGSKGLSKTAKIAVGVAVPLFCLLAALEVLWIVNRCKKRRAKKNSEGPINLENVAGRRERGDDNSPQAATTTISTASTPAAAASPPAFKDIETQEPPPPYRP
ncbi:aspartic peptidase domain-containing protein [Podospora australis]|uniref:Aspartic peptidase domain-containing protein n=1 Tax=Podospora australis TaxID=1536484 RepID=A0AAN6WL71_9PEZI|nr:aspartic peptidase domain-containing protein [Podospora australis]